MTILFHGGQFPLLMFLFSLFLSVQISFSASFPLSAWACLSFTFFAFFSLCFSPQNSCFFIVFTLSHSLFKKYLFIYLFIYFLATPCSMRDLKFPDQGSNPHPLKWKRGVLTTGPPGIGRASCRERV